jgi:hypothetical protein
VGGEKRFAERASGPDHALALYALQARSLHATFVSPAGSCDTDKCPKKAGR